LRVQACSGCPSQHSTLPLTGGTVTTVANRFKNVYDIATGREVVSTGRGSTSFVSAALKAIEAEALGNLEWRLGEAAERAQVAARDSGQVANRPDDLRGEPDS
jgi:hypothetical protein